MPNARARFIASRDCKTTFASVRALLLLPFLLLALYFPLPGLAQELNFPELTGRVVDLAGLLDPERKAELTSQLEAHENETSNQIVVATVPTLNGYDIADYSNRLGRHWQIGTAEEDNGVLLVVAPNERKVRIEVGYGLEGALTDSLSSIIIQREILPAFRKDQFGGGIESGVAAIMSAVAGEYTAPGNPTSNRDSDQISSRLGNLLPLIFIAMVGIPEILRRVGNRKAAKGAFPAGFSGLFATLATGNLLIGLGIAVVVFTFVYFFGSGGGGSGSSRRGGRHHGGYLGTGGFTGGGSFTGGGFGGGGGSFGGGGASGSW